MTPIRELSGFDPCLSRFRYGSMRARQVFQIGDLAILVHHRGDTTLPGCPPPIADGQTILFLHDAGGNGNCFKVMTT